jgi:hypothetical protein
MPGPACGICQHDRRDEINRLLAAGRGPRAISRQLAVSEDAVLRHRRHVPRQLVRTLEVRQRSEDLDLFQLLEQNIARTTSWAEQAFTDGQRNAAASFLRVHLDSMALMARLKTDAALLGQQASQPSLDLLESKQIVDRLSPGARIELARALADQRRSQAG